MAKPFPLQPLVHIAKQKNEAAIQNLGLLNQQHQAAQGKLDTLQQFRRDYQEKFQDAAKNGMAPIDLRNFQDFIYRLDQAITQQSNIINNSRMSVHAGQLELQEAKRKMQSFETLAQRHHQEEQKIEAKIEQKMQDEHAGRFAAYKAAEILNEEAELLGVNHE
ncbi:MAG: flagellar export protein FliJ [Gallionellaceae bacterium]